MGRHRLLPTPQPAHLPASYQKAVLPSASPLPLPHTQVLDLRLPAIGRASLTICRKPSTAGAFPALACLPSG